MLHVYPALAFSSRAWSRWGVLYAAVEAALAARGVTRAGDARVLVACSGGPDSVALAHVVCKLYGGPRVVLGHVDHAVRPDSAEDARAVAALAARLGCEAAAERLPGGSDAEAALRAARYAALERLRAAGGAAWVLTAHTADDQAETVLLALLSRTHADALAGMPQERGSVLRPWLEVPRGEVLAHVARHRLPVRLDETNLEPRYLRNRVRKELLPLLETRYRPGLARRLAALAAALSKPEAPGRSPPPVAAEPGPAPEPGPVSPPIWIRREAWRQGASIPDGRRIAAFDAQVVHSVHLRALRPGDRLRPFGGVGRRKVRDVLREAGIDAAARGLWQVVTDDADRVLWVPGLLRSSHAPIGEKTTSVWLLGVDHKDELRGGASRATLDGAAPGAHAPSREKNE